MVTLNDFQRSCYYPVALLLANLDEVQKYAKEEVRLMLLKRSQGLDPVWHIEGTKYPNWKTLCGRDIARDNILSTKTLRLEILAKHFVKHETAFCKKCITLLLHEYVRSLWLTIREKDLTLLDDSI